MRKAVFPENGEAIELLQTALNGLPFLSDILQSQVKQFHGSFFIGKRSARLDDLPQGHIQRLYRVGGVNDLADLGREREERHDLLPVPAPERRSDPLVSRTSAAAALEFLCRSPSVLQVCWRTGVYTICFIPSHAAVVSTESREAHMSFELRMFRVQKH